MTRIQIGNRFSCIVIYSIFYSYLYIRLEIPPLPFYNNFFGQSLAIHKYALQLVVQAMTIPIKNKLFSIKIIQTVLETLPKIKTPVSQTISN